MKQESSIVFLAWDSSAALEQCLDDWPMVWLSKGFLAALLIPLCATSSYYHGTDGLPPCVAADREERKANAGDKTCLDCLLFLMGFLKRRAFKEPNREVRRGLLCFTTLLYYYHKAFFNHDEVAHQRVGEIASYMYFCVVQLCTLEEV